MYVSDLNVTLGLLKTCTAASAASRDFVRSSLLTEYRRRTRLFSFIGVPLLPFRGRFQFSTITPMSTGVSSIRIVHFRIGSPGPRAQPYTPSREDRRHRIC